MSAYAYEFLSIVGFFFPCIIIIAMVYSNCGYKETLKCALTWLNLKMDSSTVVITFKPKPPVNTWCPSRLAVWSVRLSIVCSLSNCVDAPRPQALHIKSWHKPEIIFFSDEFSMNSDGDIFVHVCNKWDSLYVIFGMKILLVSLNMVHGLRLYKRHFAFSFNKSIFVLKSPQIMLLQRHAVQQELCQHHPLQGVAKWQHQSYGGTFCLA